MGKKVNFWKILADILGYGFGLGSSLFLANALYNMFKYGGFILYEENPLISIIETIISVLGSIFFASKIISLIRHPEKYIEK